LRTTASSSPAEAALVSCSDLRMKAAAAEYWPSSNLTLERLDRGDGSSGARFAAFLYFSSAERRTYVSGSQMLKAELAVKAWPGKWVPNHGDANGVPTVSLPCLYS